MLEEPLDWRWYVGVGLGYGAAIVVLGHLGLATLPVRAGLAGATFAALGTLCLLNWTRCGSVHCVVSGPPYLALGAGAALVAAGVVTVSIGLLWSLFAVVILASFGLEWVLDRREPGPA